MKLLSAILVMLLPALGFAQDTDTVGSPPQLLFGFNAGATYAGLHGNDVSGNNNTTIDYLVGLSLEVSIDNVFSIIGNANYERLALTRNIPFGAAATPDGGYGTRLVLQNITVPINFKCYIGPSKDYYINAGPFARYFLGETVRINGEGVTDSSYGNFQRFTYGVNLGLGMHFVVNDNDAITIEVRDNLGLSNLTRETAAGGNSVKTNSLNLILSYQFGF